MQQSNNTDTASQELEKIQALKDTDPWLHNKQLNLWEKENRAIRLESYPRDISLPFIVGKCNSQCLFCSYWQCDHRFMTEAELDEYSDIFPYLEFVGINPAGEPLMHPNFGAMLSKIRSMVDERCTFYLVTNGILLKDHIDPIIENLNCLTVSLNAATQETHTTVMGAKGRFDDVIEGLSATIKKAKEQGSNIQFYTTYVVLNQNIHEIPEFIDLAERVGLDRIYFRTIATGNDENPIKPGCNEHYTSLPAYKNPDFEEHKERARKRMATATIDIDADIEEWSKDIFIDEEPSLEDSIKLDFRKVDTSGEKIDGTDNDGWVVPEEGTTPVTCQYLYKYMIDPRVSNIQPVCVYMETLPGFKPIALEPKKKDFFDNIRNAPAMLTLRTALRDGPRVPRTCLQCNILQAFKASE